MDQLKHGTLLQGGKYVIERALGQGGFGITYLARHELLDREMAIKEFFFRGYCERDSSTSSVTLGTQSSRSTVERFLQKFVKEAKTLSKLSHPNIIQIHDVFLENNTAYYVMEYVEGQSLGELVKSRGALPEWQAVDYVRQVADALAYIHGKGINHLDVKPGNVMLRADGKGVVLIDFGVAKQYDPDTGDGTTTTTVGVSHGYSPPEQYASGGVKSFSPESDVYALGATLYKLVTGETPPEAMALAQEGLPPLPSSLSLGCREAISRSMRSRKSERPRSVGEFLSLLDGVEAETSVDVGEQTTVDVKPSPEPSSDKKEPAPSREENDAPQAAKRRPWGKYLLVACAAAFLFLLLGLGLRGRSDTEVINISDHIYREKVSNMSWDSPLGEAVYSGWALKETSDGVTSTIPHDDKGKARIVSGKNSGAVYEGEFNHGKMDGAAVYTCSNGDVFEGTFKDNHYSKGKYTIKESGEYFVGTFKVSETDEGESETDEGDWFDKDGSLLQ